MTLVCTVCGSSDVVAVHPGAEPTLRVFVCPGAPLTAWCLACWPFLRPTTPKRLEHGNDAE
jgi:hypothetical protein